MQQAQASTDGGMLEAAVIVVMFISISNLLGYIFLQKPTKEKKEPESQTAELNNA
jgi:hypothetical protein